jgi:hypothetical protein
LALGDLVAHLMSQKRETGAKKRKGNYAAAVKEKTPQSPGIYAEWRVFG